MRRFRVRLAREVPLKPDATELAAGELATSVIETVQGGRRADSDWSRVRELASGTEINVTVQGSRARRYVIAAEESQLTTLNLTDPTLPRAATRALLDMVSNHAEYVLSAQKGGTFENHDVRVAGDGVFLAGRKVADLGLIVERIARTDVVEIKRKIGVVQRHYQIRGNWHVLVGMVSVGMAGGMIGGAVDCSVATCDNNARTLGGLGGAMVGGVAGMVIGGILGNRWHRASGHETGDVIYRAP